MLRRGLILDLSIGLGMFSFFSLFSFDLDLLTGWVLGKTGLGFVFGNAFW